MRPSHSLPIVLFLLLALLLLTTSTFAQTPHPIQFQGYSNPDPSVKAALVYTDVKLDDLLAHQVLALSGKYTDIVVAITAVEEQALAQQILEDFLHDMRAEQTGVRFHYLRADNPFPFGAPHEKTWEGYEPRYRTSGAYRYSGEALDSLLRGKSVDVFQIAPVAPHDTSILVDLPHDDYFDIHLFHVTHGYNTRIASAGSEEAGVYDEAAQVAWVRGIEARVLRHNPDAHVVFTDSSVNTWLGQDGKSQRVTDLLEAGVPKRYIDMALWDNFPARQFGNALRLMDDDDVARRDDIVGRIVPPAWLRRSRSLRRGVYADRDGDGWSHRALQAMHYGRSNPTTPLGRAINAHYVALGREEIMPWLVAELEDLAHRDQVDTQRYRTAKTVLGRFRYDVVPMFEVSQVEAYDANHIMAVLASRDGKMPNAGDGFIRLKLHQENDDWSALSKLHPAPPNEVGHGWKLEPVPRGWSAQELPQWFARIPAIGAQAADSASSSLRHFVPRSLGPARRLQT
ncbi:uncharacterized protein PFL1_01112 [Pseudozyma flocculosa PF-1]|uniref:Uncharacterized protein n=1 Tax=Pseudozyma flocculosa TaxID=84751 RepID=A0A5C3FC25_9BASI|nr:uncharacterized protein PFL1_01112 [Pseudozyma flocculosa PF-1]EPQ31780.1 hypothetical protein PFL1_01112 [Pseudozyma flocculosa PF-1]SPO41830.1 uncharacterized protein PSFLO_07312 [Pseudozyma flocculosa]